MKSTFVNLKSRTKEKERLSGGYSKKAGWGSRYRSTHCIGRNPEKRLSVSTRGGRKKKEGSRSQSRKISDKTREHPGAAGLISKRDLV